MHFQFSSHGTLKLHGMLVCVMLPSAVLSGIDEKMLSCRHAMRAPLPARRVAQCGLGGRSSGKSSGKTAVRFEFYCILVYVVIPNQYLTL